MKYKILIGSNGRLTGGYLAKRFRILVDFEVYGADCTVDLVGKYFVNKQFLLPSAMSKLFVEKLIKLLLNENVDIYFPTHFKEIKAVALNTEEIY